MNYRKLDSKLIQREVEGEVVLVSQATGEVHQLNPVATWIWYNLRDNTDLRELAGRVANQFETEIETAKKDVERFLSNLIRLGLIEEEQ